MFLRKALPSSCRGRGAINAGLTPWSQLLRRLPHAGANLSVRQVVPQGDFMSFGLYAAGFAIVIGGLVYAAHLVHMPTHWIVVGAIVMIGVGILSAVKATRQKDSAS
jgi:hypothetical protein